MKPRFNMEDANRRHAEHYLGLALKQGVDIRDRMQVQKAMDWLEGKRNIKIHGRTFAEWQQLLGEDS